MKTLRTTKKLPVRLTQDEKVDRGAKLVDNLQKTGIAESERDAESKRRRGDIEKLELITAAYMAIIAKGEEDREVECEIQKDFEHATVTTIRMDTGEVVETRTMTMDELKAEMPFDEKAGRDPAKGKGGDPFGEKEGDKDDGGLGF